MLWSVGVAACGLALVVLLAALGGAGDAAYARSLAVAGTALLAGGVGACALGWRPRRLWVQLDADALSRPWARGSARLELRQLSGLQAARGGSVVVSSTTGAQLRIDAELPEFAELLEQLCDQISDNGYPTTVTQWREGQRRAALNAREVSFRHSERGPPTSVSWAEIAQLNLARDERQHLVPALELADGRRLSLPYVGRSETLELYRALRQNLRRASLPAKPESIRARRAQ